jgi:hypothetical protein
MGGQTPAERSTNAKIAANARWARTPNRSLATAKARANGPGSLEYWLTKVDPDGEMVYADRVRAADNAKAEFYGRAMKNARKSKAAKRNGAAA